MKKFASTIVVLVALLCVTTPALADEAKKTVLEGTWKASGGAPFIKEMKITGSTFEVTGDMDGTKVTFKGTIKLNAKSNPKSIDMTIKDGPEEKYVGKTSRGIFKIEKGTLTWCANEPGKEGRPKEFEMTESHILVKFTKKK